MKSVNTLRVLEQLRQMRERSVNELTAQVARQKQLCQRYLNNINSLNALCHDAPVQTQGALERMNQTHYKANIQRVIAWQEQEQALAEMRARELQADLTEQACREKTVDLVLAQQREALAKARGAQEQKNTDGLALQSWLRNRNIRRKR